MSSDRMVRRTDVLGTEVSGGSFEEAVVWLHDAVSASRAVYVTPATVYSIMLGRRDPEYQSVVNSAHRVVADGVPVVWTLRLKGQDAERVHGDDLLLEFCRRYGGVRHFLLGGAAGQAQEVAEALRRRYPGIEIVGAISTPQRPILPQENEHIVQAIRASAAQVVWVGMGTPAQDRWTSESYMRVGVPLVGVGSAFDLLTGRKAPAPDWMKRSGLQWLHRLVQDPRRLWRRYALNNPMYIMLTAVALIRDAASRRFGGLRAGSTGELWNSFGRHGIRYVVSETIAKGGTFAILVGLAAIVSPSQFGWLNVYLVLSGIGAVVVGLGLPDGVFRDYFRRERFGRSAAAALLLISLSGASLILLTALFLDGISTWLALPGTLIILAALTAPAAAVRQLCMNLLRARERSNAFLAYRAAEPVLVLLLVGAVLYRGGANVILFALPFAIAPFLIAFAAVVSLRSSARLEWSVSAFRPLLRYSVPLVFHALAMSGLATFDQIILNQIEGATSAGEYALAYRLSMAMYLVMFGLAAAWSPIVFSESGRWRGADGEAVAKLAMRVAMATGVILSVSLPLIAPYIVRSEFDVAFSLIPWMVYSYVWLALYGIAVPFMLRTGATVRLALLSGSAVVLNIVLNYALIPRFGVQGAVATTVVSYVALCLLVIRNVGEPESPFVPLRRYVLELTLLMVVPIVLTLL